MRDKQQQKRKDEKLKWRAKRKAAAGPKPSALRFGALEGLFEALPPDIPRLETTRASNWDRLLKSMFKGKPAVREVDVKRHPLREGMRYRLKVTLQGTQPEIWRRIEVPGNLRLDRLAKVILAAMPWDGWDHLHDFHLQGVSFMTHEGVLQSQRLGSGTVDGRKFALGRSSSLERLTKLFLLAAARRPQASNAWFR